MKEDSTDISQAVSQVDTLSYRAQSFDKIPIRNVEVKPSEESQTIVEQLFYPSKKLQQVDSWQSILLIATVLLLGLAKAFSVNRFSQTYKSLFNYRVAQEICSEEKVFFHRVNVLLTINYFLITTLFIYQLKESLNPSLLSVGGAGLYLMVLAFLVTLNFGKLIFSKILAFVFNTPHLVSDYIFNVSLFNNLLGVLLVPVLATMYFTSLEFDLTLLFFALPLLFISFILRLLRVVVLGNAKGVSYMYIFLYICSLEILPLVVILKIFILK